MSRSDHPIACSLAPGALAARLAEWRALKADALLTEHASGSTITARYANRDGVAERLRALVAAEATCCPWLSFDVSEGEYEIELTVTAPGDAAQLLASVAEPAQVAAPPVSGGRS